MKRLKGKRAIITGGLSGIGAATVERFRAEGAEVIVFDRVPGADAIEVDVSNIDQVEAAFKKIGAVDVVVNNAGISFRSPALDISPGQWQLVLSVNLTGVFNVAQAAARFMLAGNGGVILNTASTNGYVGHPFYADYNASKAGVIELTRTLALEWAPKVRVNAVCPGYVLTPMQKAEYTPEMMAKVNARIPSGRHAEPAELAGLFAYLASDEAAYFTGSIITMDGGETAGGTASWHKSGD